MIHDITAEDARLALLGLGMYATFLLFAFGPRIPARLRGWLWMVPILMALPAVFYLFWLSLVG